jgi:hypothetical protein
MCCTVSAEVYADLKIPTSIVLELIHNLVNFFVFLVILLVLFLFSYRIIHIEIICVVVVSARLQQSEVVDKVVLFFLTPRGLSFRVREQLVRLGSHGEFDELLLGDLDADLPQSAHHTPDLELVFLEPGLVLEDRPLVSKRYQQRTQPVEIPEHRPNGGRKLVVAFEECFERRFPVRRSSGCFLGGSFQNRFGWRTCGRWHLMNET